MFIFLLIYIPGIIATLWIWYYSLGSGTRITLTELLVAILMCIFSWITFLILIVIIYGDKIVFEKK